MMAVMYAPTARRLALEALAGESTLSEVSRVTGVARSTLREWQATGGTYKNPGTSMCPRTRPVDGAAYAHLLGLYLGDGCLSRHARGVYALRIACDATYTSLVEECAGSMRATLPNPVYYNPAPGCIQVTALSKHWPCLFPQHGPGRKHERPIALEPWQATIVQQYPGRFLRGLFHSDGCRIINWTERRVGGKTKRYEYPRYFFTNYSDDILRLCEWALDLVGVDHRRANRRNVSVARRNSVALLDVHVGPKS
jgi:hypothetical protein